MSEDPIGFEAGVNFYAYVNNNPVNFNDPMGLDVGDVYALESNSTMGNFITLFTDGPYSHVLVELSGGRALQSVYPGGTEIVNLANTLNGRNYDVYRSVDFNSGAIPGLENFADFSEGTPYGLGSCQQVCSTLVNEAAEFSGFGSFGGLGDFSFTVPNDIILSDDFQLINTSDFGLTPQSFNGGGASGGFVLYPNHINTNTITNVYSK